MYIKSLTGSGIKSRKFQHDLTPGVMITGPNFSGKTTILSAIRLGCMGYLPELGKTNAATAKIGNGTHFGTRLKFDNGVVLDREFRVQGEKVSAECSNPSFAELIACPLLNSAEYFSVGPSERLEYVLRRSDTSIFEEFSVPKTLANLRAVRLEEETEETEVARRDILEKCEKVLRANPLQEGIVKLTADKVGILKVEYSTWNKKATDSIGAVRTITELKLREAECSPETIADVEQKIAASEARVKEAHRELGALEAQRDKASQTERRKKDLELMLSEAVVGFELAKLQRAYDDAKAGADQAKPLPDAGPLKKAAREAQEEYSEIAGELSGKRKSYERVKAELEEVKSLKCCPKCGSKGKDWRKKLETSAQADVDRHESEIRDLNAKLETARSAQDRAKLALDDYEARLKETEELADALIKSSRDLDVAKTKAEKREGWSRELAALQISAAPADDIMQAAVREEKAATDELAGLKARLRSATELARDIAQAEKAAGEHRIAKAYVHLIKAVGVKLKETKAQMIAKVFGQVCEIANRILADVLPSPLAYHEDSLGRWAGTMFVDHETFSGTEEALTYVAIAAALSTLSPFRILMLDEFSRLDPRTKQKVLLALEKALGDKLVDQVIIVDVIEPVWSPEGWTHIDLGK